MKTLNVLFLTLFLIKVETLNKCPERSFKKLTVKLVEKHQSRTQTVKQCISPENLFYNHKDLQKITISDQNIPVLKKGFINNILADFSLTMSHNDIEVIEAEAFLNLPQVDAIDLKYNLIAWIESNAFVDLLYLKYLDLSHNKIEQLLHNTFHNLPNVEILALNNNNLKAFQQDSFYNLNSLEIIYLDFNQITSIPRATFNKIPSLIGVSLSNNHISFIHKYAFQGLNLLQSLLLDNNRLKKIDVNFTVNPILGILDINNNNITYISDKSLSTLEDSLDRLWIHANPWQCGCFDKIMQWSARSNVPVFWRCKGVELFCVTPKRTPKKCIERTDDDFYPGCFIEFDHNCKKDVG